MADSEPDIIIRPFEARKDLKEVQLLVGMGAMEQLAIANRIAYSHPFAISVWLALASAIIQALHLWPTGSGPNGWLGYLAPVPPLACTAVPVMFAIDWLNRPHFERMLKTRIQSLTTSVSVLSTNSSKFLPLFLVMEYKKTPIGYIFVQPIPSIQSDAKSGTRTMYRIAHFHVDAPYRHTGVGNDLLSRAIQDLEKTKVDIVGVSTRLTPYTAECLRAAGFTRDDGVVQIWDEGKKKEAGYEEDKEGDVDSARIVLVDTRRVGWRLRRM